MNMTSLHRRLEALERDLSPSEPILLLMPDGRTETLRGDVADLLSRAIGGDRTPEMELISQSVSSIEPGGGKMIELARALLNGPVETPKSSQA